MSLTTLRVPDLGEGIAEVELVAWRVQPGDAVAEDQILCDVMTDKATVEIPSSLSGRVVDLGGAVGQMLAVGAVLVRIEAALAAGADAPPDAAALAGAAPASERAPSSAAVSVASPVARADGTSDAAPATPPAVAALPPPGRPAHALAAPAVRARARALGIALDNLCGSGPEGRIVHADLDAAVRRGPATLDSTQVVQLVGLRRRMAQRMQAAMRDIPHFTYVEEVDVTGMLALREVLNARHAQVRGSLSPLVFIARSVALAVADFPAVNARFDGEAGQLTLHDAVHLGMATATDAGLLVPVVRQAQARDLWGCAAEMARLAAAARAGKATRDELSGSTITLTSLGKLGGVVSTPVINPPEVAIVGVNRIVARPVVLDGTVQVRQMMNLSSSFDHRVIDGATAAGFVQRVRQLLEQPALLFIEP